MYTVCVCDKTILISAGKKYKPSTVTFPVKIIDIVTRIETVYMFPAGYQGFY